MIIQQLDAGLTRIGRPKVAWVLYDANGINVDIVITDNTATRPNWEGVKLPDIRISNAQFADLKVSAKHWDNKRDKEIKWVGC